MRPRITIRRPIFLIQKATVRFGDRWHGYRRDLLMLTPGYPLRSIKADLRIGQSRLNNCFLVESPLPQL